MSLFRGYSLLMSRLKLRRFEAADQLRLGALLARAKQGLSSDDEDMELLALLSRARRVSMDNARRLSELREKPAIQLRKRIGAPASPRADGQAKIS
jgi:hypothetical protein